jgi:hypothetical protein
MLYFLFAVIVIYFVEKKKRNIFLLAAVLYSTVQLLFKANFLVELGLSLVFPEGKRRSK